MKCEEKDEAGGVFFISIAMACALGGGVFLVLKGTGVNEDLSAGASILIGLATFVGLLLFWAWTAVQKDAKDKAEISEKEVS